MTHSSQRKRTTTVVARRNIDAPILAVFDAATSVNTFVRLPGVKGAALIKPGVSDDDLTGGIRRIDATGLGFEEEITEWDPGVRMRYRIVHSWPARVADQHGAVSLYQTPDGVEVLWQSTFRVDLPIAGRLVTWLAGPLTKFAFGRALALAEQIAQTRTPQHA
jgi:hypothetical protein